MASSPAASADETVLADESATPAGEVLRALLPAAGTALVALGTLLIALLHVVPPSSRVNPMTRTLSEYALGGNGWAFDIAVLSLAAGSIMVLVVLIRAEVLRAASMASVLVAVWVAGLIVLVIFEKYDHHHGVSNGPSGMIHRMASLVAFLSLPTGALLATRNAGRRPRWRRPLLWTRGAAIIAWAFLCLLLYAIGNSLLTGVAWWRVFPLGAMERLIGLAEVAVVFALGCWAISAAKLSRPASLPTARR